MRQHIIGQASLDKYVRVAEIAAQNGNSANMMGFRGSKPPVKTSKNKLEDEPSSEG